MRPEDYSEEDALMAYVWRNYPDIMRPDECVPTDAAVRDQLPPELRDEYWLWAMECSRIVAESMAEDQRLSKDGTVVDSEPILPEMRPELGTAVNPIFFRLRWQVFQERLRLHQDRVTIARCPRCNRILINEHSRQCLWCRFDWHEKT